MSGRDANDGASHSALQAADLGGHPANSHMVAALTNHEAGSANNHPRLDEARREVCTAHIAYGALARSTGDDSTRERTWRRHRRFFQAGIAVAALAVGVLLGASVVRTSVPAQNIQTGPMIVLEEKKKNDDVYCSVFQDPSECEEPGSSSGHSDGFWNDAQVRSELWKTMGAMSELELREAAMHKAHKAKMASQSNLLDLFRKTMSTEVETIHRLQDEMNQRHTSAFRQLVLQVSGMAIELKNYTDTIAEKVDYQITKKDQIIETNDNEGVLKDLANRINIVNRKIEDLHRETMTAVNGTQAYAENVESKMKANDLRLDGMITQIETDEDSLDSNENWDWGNLSVALRAAEQKQEADRKVLDAKIDTEVSALRGESSRALDAERVEIRQQLAEAMSIIANDVMSVTRNETARYDGIQSVADAMIAEQTANNEDQAVHIGKLRNSFEEVKNAAMLRLDAADKRIDTAFISLAAAKSRLESQAAADKAFILAKIKSDVQLRDQEALELRNWGKDETDAIRHSLDRTQSTLDSNRPILQAQRDANMAEWRDHSLAFGRIWNGKISTAFNDWNASVNRQMDKDNTAIHAALTDRLKEADDSLEIFNKQMTTNDANVLKEWNGMKGLQVQNNELQKKAIDDLERDTKLEKKLAEARLEALDGNMSAVKERLQAVRAELKSNQEKNRAAAGADVDKDFDVTKKKLDADLSVTHTELRDKLNNGLARLTNFFNYLKATSEANETMIDFFENNIAKDQRKEKTQERLSMDALSLAQSQDASEIETITDELVEDLGTLKAKLAAQLSRISIERKHDDAEMRSEIDSDNKVTATDADDKLAVTHDKMNSELASVASKLTATLDAHKKIEETQFQNLVSKLASWDAAQNAVNAHQRAWLKTISGVSKDAVQDVGGSTASLRKALKIADAQLTASTVKLEKQQRATAKALNNSLHADIASLNAVSLAFIKRTHVYLMSRIDGDIGELTARLNELQSAASSTELEITKATDAMRNQIEARQVARTAALADIIQQAKEDKSAMEARIDELLKRIKKGSVNIGTELKKSEADGTTYSANVERYIDEYLQKARDNSSLVLAQTESSLFDTLEAQVDKWTTDLTANKEASITEAAAIDVKLRQIQTAELLQSSTTRERLMQLVSTIENSHDSADTTISSLRAGLTAEMLKLNATVAQVTADQQDDKIRIMAQIKESLAELRASFAAAQKEQLESLQDALKTKSTSIDETRSKLMADMLQKESILNKTLTDLTTKQEAGSEAHAVQIEAMQGPQRKVRAQLQKALDIVDGSVRVVANELENAKNREDLLQTQDFKSLADKLGRDTAEMNSGSSGVKASTIADMQNAKSQLVSAKTSLVQLHSELVREEKSDQPMLKGEVQNKINVLSGKMNSAVQTALTALETALNAQTSQLASGVDQIKTKTTSAESDLLAKMSQLERLETENHVAQDKKIKAMQALKTTFTLSIGSWSAAFTANISRVQGLMETGLKTLNNVQNSDKREMVSKVLPLVTQAQTMLKDTLTAQQSQLQDMTKKSLDNVDSSVTQSTEQVNSLAQNVEDTIKLLSAGDATADGKWDANVRTLHALLDKLRDGARRNNTEIHEKLLNMMDKVAAEQDVVIQSALADKRVFQTDTKASFDSIKSNFTGNVGLEGRLMMADLRPKADTMDDLVKTRYQGNLDKEADLRNKLKALLPIITTAFDARDREISAINATATALQDGLAGKVTRYQKAVEDAVSAGDSAKNRNFELLDNMRNRLQLLLVEAAKLEALREQIGSVQTQMQRVSKSVADDYTATAEGSANINAKILTWRSQLSESSRNLRLALQTETGKRVESHRNSTLEMQAAAVRMGQIERDIGLMEKRLIDRGGRPFRSSTGGGTGASASAASAATATAGPSTMAPAPAPVRPPLALGETPPPEPLPWWDYRTQWSGVDISNGRIALVNGATSGYLMGVYPLSADGQWLLYATMFASAGDLDATIKVSYNGVVAATVKNDPKSGFPCSGNVCLSNVGRNVVEGMINDGELNYFFEFTATKAELPSPEMGNRMWLGAGEAAFIGNSAAPPMPSLAPQITIVTAVNAMTGVATAQGSQGQSGEDVRGYSYPTEPRLTVLWGTAVVWQGIMTKGRATVNVAPPPQGGYYSCVVTQAGLMAFYTKFCEIGTNVAKLDVPLAPVMKPGEAKLVLTWGKTPKDCDLYLLAPHQDPRKPPCEVSWKNKNCFSSKVTLDRDDTESHGPETISLSGFMNPGKYVVRVDEYMGNPLAQQLVGGHATVAYYSPHMGGMLNYAGSQGYIDGKVWYVLAIDGTTRQPVACTPEICPKRPLGLLGNN